MNIYNAGQLSQAVAVESAQLVDGAVYDFDPASGRIGSTSVHAMRIAGGNHPTGAFTAFAAPSGVVDDDDDAEHVFYAVKKIGENKCMVLALTAAITATYSTKTASLPIDGTPADFRLADALDAVTLTSFGSVLAAKYDAFTPERVSPGSNALAYLFWASLPSMWGLAVDIWGTGENARHVLWDSHT